MDDLGESGVLFPLECQACHETFPARLSDAMAAKLNGAGVTGEEISEAINRGLLSWGIVCPTASEARRTSAG